MVTAAHGAVRFFFTRGQAPSSHHAMEDDSPHPQGLTPEEIARLEAARAVLAAAPREADALEFAIEGDRFVIVQGYPDDVAAAADPHVIARHGLIIDKLRDLEEAVGSRLDNQRAWRGLPRTIRRLLAAADAPMGEMPQRLVELYDHTVSLASFVEQDDAIGKDPRASDEPLDADIRRALADAIGSLAPWLRSFPTVQEWDGARHDFLTRPELYEAVRARLPDVRKVLEAARETGALSPEDAARALEPVETAENAAYLGLQAEKAGYRALATGRRFVTAVLCGVAGLFGGAVFSDAATKSIVIQSAGTVVARNIDETWRIIGTMSEDLQTAARELSQRIGELMSKGTLPFPLPTPPPTPPATLRPDPPSDFDIGEVRRLIRAGQAPPVAWVPFIRTLGFYEELSDFIGLAGLSYLEELEVIGAPAVDLMPLVGLTKLRQLKLAIVRVSDLKPLRSLTNIEVLHVVASGVHDIEPLRGLTSLKELDLSGNEVSHIAPLSNLTALQSLNLSGTHVRMVSSLSGLTALRTLDLSGTPVSDVAPLSGLHSLQELIVDSGVDVTPLAHLTALTITRRGRSGRAR